MSERIGKHSPAPWALYEPWANGTFSADPKHRHIIINDGRKTDDWIMADGKTPGPTGWAVCNAEGCANMALEEILANARLITAAPDMLAALRAIIEHREPIYPAEWISLKKLGSAAIAKARGE